MAIAWPQLLTLSLEARHQPRRRLEERASNIGVAGFRYATLNGSTRKHIYHMPGEEYYDETAISIGKGERWFWSEKEARATGWCKARR